MSIEPDNNDAINVSALLIPVRDMEAACNFLEQVLNLELKFRDGDRYAEFDFNGLALALLADEERIVDAPSLSIRVKDMRSALSRLEAAGAVITAPVASGPHELRSVMQLPGGPIAVVSQKKPAEP